MKKRMGILSIIMAMSIVMQQCIWAAPQQDAESMQPEHPIVTDYDGVREIEIPHHEMEGSSLEELMQKYNFSKEELYSGRIRLVMTADEEPDLADLEEYYLGWGTKNMANTAAAEAKRLVGVLTTDGMSDIEKIYAFSKYLNTEVAYGGLEESRYRGQTAYEALIQKRAVCAGKTCAMDMLCYYAGVNVSHVISHSAKHAWNKVELNGKWYNVDTTNFHSGYFLISDKNYTYHHRDTVSYEDDYNKKYTYDGKFHTASDTRFEGAFAFTWESYKSRALKEKNVNTDYYASSTIKGIDVTPVRETDWYEHMTPRKSDYTVQSYKLSGDGTAPLCKASVTNVAGSKYSLETKQLEMGLNQIRFAHSVKGQTLTKTVEIDAKADVIQAEELYSVRARYIPENREVGKYVDPTDFEVIPTIRQKYASGYVDNVEGDADLASAVNTSRLLLGKNNILVSYEKGGITKSAKVTVTGTKPDVKSVSPVEDGELILANGQPLSASLLGNAKAVLSDGTEVILPVQWENCADRYDPDDPNATPAFKVTGEVNLPDYVRNRTQKFTVERTVRSAAASQKLTLSADPASRSSAKSFVLKLQSSDGARIFYSVDESEYKTYVGPIAVTAKPGTSGTVNVKAYAKKRGFWDSDLMELTYQLDIPESGDAGLEDLEEAILLMKGEKRRIFESGYTYVSSDPAIVSVDKKGNLTAKRDGTAIVSRTKNGEPAGRYHVTVQTPAFGQRTYYISSGQSMSLVLEGTQEPVTYSIPTKCKTARLDGNVLTGLKKGKVVVSAIVHGKKYTTTVVVETPAVKQRVLFVKRGSTQTLKVRGTKRSPAAVITSNSSSGMEFDETTGRLTVAKDAVGSLSVCYIYDDGLEYTVYIYVK